MILLLEVAAALYARKQVNALNYGQIAQVTIEDFIGKKSFGIASKVLVNILLGTLQFGFCTVHFVFVGEHLQDVFCTAFGVYLDVRAWISLLILPFLFAAIFIKELDTISVFSTVSTVLLLYNFCVLAYVGVSSVTTLNGAEKAEFLNANNTVYFFVGTNLAKNIPFFFTSAVFSFEFIGLVLPAENKMRHPHHARGLFIVILGTVLIVYVAFGMFGYSIYGNNVKGSITLNLTGYSTATTIVFILVKLFFSFNVYVNFMLQFYVAMDFIEPSIIRQFMIKLLLLPSKPLKLLIQVTFRTTVVILISVISIIVPNLPDLISLVGAVGCTVLGLIVPSALHSLALWHAKEHTKCLGIFPWPVWLVTDLLSITLGFAGLAMGLYTSLYNIITHFSVISEEECVVLG